MKIRKGDIVLIISGKDRGRKAKVMTVFPRRSKIAVEGINLRKKHLKPKKSGEKGQIVEVPGPFDVSNAKLICPKCGKPTRIGYKKSKVNPQAGGKKSPGRSAKSGIAGQAKIRICKKCGQEI